MDHLHREHGFCTNPEETKAVSPNDDQGFKERLPGVKIPRKEQCEMLVGVGATSCEYVSQRCIEFRLSIVATT